MGSSFGRAFLKAAMALPQIVPRSPLRPLEWVTSECVRESVIIDAAGAGDVVADVYRSGDRRRQCGIVMALGANELGLGDPRAVALADALARSGFVVLVMSGAPALATPDLNAPTELVKEPGRAIAAFEYLAQRREVDAQLVGFVGVCLGGGTCLLAASDSRLAGRVGFVFLIGPYFSLQSLIRAVFTGTSVDEHGRVRRWSVRPYAVERLGGWLLHALEPDDRPRVRHALEQDETPPRLSPAAAATLQLWRGTSPERADALISMLGESVLTTLAAASPMGNVADLRAPTFIMHAVGDDLIPVDESRRLARMLRGQVSLRYAEFELFEHVNVTSRLGPAVFAREVWRLAGHVAPLMQFAS